MREPAKWDVTVEQAAEIVLGDDFLACSPAGEVLDASGLAERMDHVWSLVEVECVMCGTVAQRSASKTLGCRSDPGRSRCSYCFSLPLASWQDDFFQAHGLVRDYDGYARFGQRIEARCLDCGAERNISISELKSRVAPCLSCAEATDPDAVHVIYVMRFPTLRAYKVGITSTEIRHDRIASHEARGGILLEQQEVPNREAALTVEDFVLRAVREFPSGCASSDFPQGGYTETWSGDGPAVDLARVIARLGSEEAPGFDRLSKLRSYFDIEPVTVDELVEFRHIKIIDVDGTEVHRVGFSESLE